MGMVEAFKSYGFRVNPLMQRFERVEGLVKHYHQIEEQRALLGYDIDGVVYKVDVWRCGIVLVCLAQPALGDRASISPR